ncbi:MAG: redox-sensing transcriptional repressor Rex, partial [bacterium]
MKSQFPFPTVIRLTYYLRALEFLLTQNKGETSSDELAKLTNLSPEQVRKDLAYFGSFGKRGKGYPLPKLYEKIKELIGINKEWRLCLIGLGNLGKAIVRFKGFPERKLRFYAIFENDPKKIGGEFQGIRIFDVNKLPEVARELSLDIAVFTIPDDQVDKVYELVRKTNIRGILNFTSAPLHSEKDLFVKNVSIAQELE